MLTPPMDLSEASLMAVIERGWGITVASLSYRPVGFGSHHWVVTDTEDARHFVTVDELSPESRRGDEVSVHGLHLRPALTAALDLRDVGCGFVVAPVPTTTDAPLVQFGSYSMTLYPFIEGESFSFEAPFGHVDRERILELVVALHGVPITAIRPPATDGFVVPWLERLEHAQPRNGRAEADLPLAGEASQLIVDHQAQIRRAIARYRALVARYRSHPGPVVVTHGEIHPGNVMATAGGWVMVDWDTALLAPPERDLWRLAQGEGSVLRAYADATGKAPRERLIELYEIRWDLADIASFAAELQRPHGDTEDSRKALELLGSVVGRLPS